MGKKTNKSNFIACLGLLLLGGAAYAYTLHEKKRLQEQYSKAVAYADSLQHKLDVMKQLYPEQQIVDNALTAEAAYLPQEYKLDLKRASDSLLTLVAKNAPLVDTLSAALTDFSDDEHLRCFWYRWGHQEVLSSNIKEMPFFPYNTLDSLACVILYPSIFKK